MLHNAVYLGMLWRRLNDAVAQENFEEAARLRDERDALLVAQRPTPLKQIALEHRRIYAQPSLTTTESPCAK